MRFWHLYFKDFLEFLLLKQAEQFTSVDSRKGSIHNFQKVNDNSKTHIKKKNACGVMVIIVGNGPSDSSSNPGREWLHFT